MPGNFERKESQKQPSFKDIQDKINELGNLGGLPEKQVEDLKHMQNYPEILYGILSALIDNRKKAISSINKYD